MKQNENCDNKTWFLLALGTGGHTLTISCTRVITWNLFMLLKLLRHYENNNKIIVIFVRAVVSCRICMVAWC